MSNQTSGGAAAGTSCTCTSRCGCAAPGGCRCQRQCRCTTGASHGAPPMWHDVGPDPELAQEFARGRRRYALSRGSRAWPGGRTRVARWMPAPRYAPRRAPGASARAPLARVPLHRRAHMARLLRRMRWNRYYARRAGWGHALSRLASVIGCPRCTPGSMPFTAALLRWQRLRGLPPTGVLTPAMWRLLRRLLDADGAGMPSGSAGGTAATGPLGAAFPDSDPYTEPGNDHPGPAAGRDDAMPVDGDGGGDAPDAPDGPPADAHNAPDGDAGADATAAEEVAGFGRRRLQAPAPRYRSPYPAVPWGIGPGGPPRPAPFAGNYPLDPRRPARSR